MCVAYMRDLGGKWCDGDVANLSAICDWRDSSRTMFRLVQFTLKV